MDLEITGGPAGNPCPQLGSEFVLIRTVLRIGESLALCAPNIGGWTRLCGLEPDSLSVTTGLWHWRHRRPKGWKEGWRKWSESIATGDKGFFLHSSQTRDREGERGKVWLSDKDVHMLIQRDETGRVLECRSMAKGWPVMEAQGGEKKDKGVTVIKGLDLRQGGLETS